MVITTASGIERRTGLYKIFNEMNAGTTTNNLSSMPVANKALPANPLSLHLPVKRVSSCPLSQNARAVPKRSRLAGPLDAASRVPSAMRENSYAVAMETGRKMLTQNTLVSTPRNVQNPSKGLSFIPPNATRLTVNCCTKDNLCFGALTSAGSSTPPYGSCGNETFASGGAKGNRRASRKILSRKLKRKAPYVGDVISNVKSKENVKSTTTGSFYSQPNALVVYNAFLRQLEKEGEKKKTQVKQEVTETRDDDFGYSPGFAPSVTSTPQHKAPMTSHCSSKKATSDYYSKPSSDGFSSKSSYNQDSFTDFLRYIEDGILSEAHRRVLEEKSLKRVKVGRDSTMDPEVFDSGCHFRRVSRTRDGGFTRKRFVTSTPQHDASDCDVTNNNDVKLPGMYPIGAPRAASSPIMFQQRPVAGTGADGSGHVWRPWC